MLNQSRRVIIARRPSILKTEDWRKLISLVKWSGSDEGRPDDHICDCKAESCSIQPPDIRSGPGCIEHLGAICQILPGTGSLANCTKPSPRQESGQTQNARISPLNLTIGLTLEKIRGLSLAMVTRVQSIIIRRG